MSRISWRICYVTGKLAKLLTSNLNSKFDAVCYLQEPDDDMFFALKQLELNDPISFRREVEMLQKFNSTKHPHIVTFLASFTRLNKNYLIFPWATHDLRVYWEKVRPMPDAGDVDLVQWICHQAWMLVEAVSRIHLLDEEREIPEKERLYGRHGDLKPENILWYESRTGFGKLVIADMGLSKTHRFVSRTYVPHRVIATPRYRPPEADYQDGVMGRTFDIWTLGCTFLELLSWLHGGYEQLSEMFDSMMTPSIRGYDSEEYFEWVYVEDAEYYTIRVKEVVTEVSSPSINSSVLD